MIIILKHYYFQNDHHVIILDVSEEEMKENAVALIHVGPDKQLSNYTKTIILFSSGSVNIVE